MGLSIKQVAFPVASRVHRQLRHPPPPRMSSLRYDHNGIWLIATSPAAGHLWHLVGPTLGTFGELVNWNFWTKKKKKKKKKKKRRHRVRNQTFIILLISCWRKYPKLQPLLTVRHRLSTARYLIIKNASISNIFNQTTTYDLIIYSS